MGTKISELPEVYIADSNDYFVIQRSDSNKKINVLNLSKALGGSSNTEIDLSNYATISDLNGKVDKVTGKSLVLDTEISKIHEHTNKTVLDSITDNKISEWNNKSNFTGSYNDLIDKPTIPTKVSQLTNDSNYTTQTYVQNKIAEAALNGGEVDLSNYVTKELGNASQITFTDGQTFQAKLDAGTLKGAKGDTGAKGQDGLTTKISMNGTTYTHVGGTITLPNCATQSYVIDKINEALSQGGGNISVSYDEVNEELTFSSTITDNMITYDEAEESLMIGGITD